MLKQFGISVDTKGRMTINESTFKKSDMAQFRNSSAIMALLSPAMLRLWITI